MIIHLESGACDSKVNESDLVYSAALCFQWAKYFISPSDRKILLEGHDLLGMLREQYTSTLIFKCPTCINKFPKLSSLFMHVESPTCSQTLDDGAIVKLRNWFAKRHTTRGYMGGL
jgi:hypothetical protein